MHFKNSILTHRWAKVAQKKIGKFFGDYVGGPNVKNINVIAWSCSWEAGKLKTLETFGG